MTKSKSQCSVCGSSETIPNVKIVDHGHYDAKHDLAIELEGNPNALIFKDKRKGFAGDGMWRLRTRRLVH